MEKSKKIYVKQGRLLMALFYNNVEIKPFRRLI